MVRKRPKCVSSKQWKLHWEIVEMNHRIIKDKMKDPLYVPNAIDDLLLEQDMYRKRKKK